MDDEEIEHMDRSQIERDLEYQKQRLLMLCRLLRTKSQEYGSRRELDDIKYESLEERYNAKMGEFYKLRQQRNNLEKEYEKIENEKVCALRKIKDIKQECNEKKKKIKCLEKQLSLKMNELDMERSTNDIDTNDEMGFNKLWKKQKKKYEEMMRQKDLEQIELKKDLEK